MTHKYFTFGLKEIIWHLEKYAYSLSYCLKTLKGTVHPLWLLLVFIHLYCFDVSCCH